MASQTRTLADPCGAAVARSRPYGACLNAFFCGFLRGGQEYESIKSVRHPVGCLDGMAWYCLIAKVASLI
jgi:hypothetical protein